MSQRYDLIDVIIYMYQKANTIKYDFQKNNKYLNFDQKKNYCIKPEILILFTIVWKISYKVPKDYCSLKTIHQYQYGLKRFICESILVDNEIPKDLLRIICRDIFFKDSGLKLSLKSNNCALLLNDNNMYLWLQCDLYNISLETYTMF